MKEVSYVMVKPEFAEFTNVINYVKERLNLIGLKIEFASFVNYDEASAKQHYAEHVGKDFYPELEKYITSGKCYGMRVSGENAIAVIRNEIGSTRNPAEGTIRYNVPMMLNRELNTTKNVVHASDSVESAQKELAIFEKLSHKNEIIR